MQRENSYSDIKLAYFEAALYYCRFKFKNGRVEGWYEYPRSEYGFAQDDISEFKHPLEDLMFHVIVILQNAGRNPLLHNSWLNTTKRIINEHTLEKLLADLTPEERQYEDEGIGFLCDLNLVLNNQELENV